MPSKRVTFCLLFAVIGLAAASAAVSTAVSTSDEQQILHALNRLTWGPRAGDMEAVSETGVRRWIERQLHPESIVENPVLLEKLALLDTLNLSQPELAARYPLRQAVRANADLRTRQPSEKPGEFVARLEAMSAQDQVAELRDLAPGVLKRLYPPASPGLRRQIQMLSGPAQVIRQDLVQAKLLRAVYSNRQLEDVLTDFWYNHFNVYLNKGADKQLVTAYERDVIRPGVLGKFRDLLVATAQSPAMLFYLDNWRSTVANGGAVRGKRTGLNENFGRELLELHTLGVDGGYSQQDVTEVARCFTGWTIRDVQSGARFFFNPRLHDKSEKHVMGVTIAAGRGMEDGLQVLEILARHPATARFISRELAVRFVSDDPPAALVEKMSRSFLASDGDLRTVMKTMFEAPEFWDAGSFRVRVKSPLELVASALRATGAEIDYTFSLASTLEQMGEPLYRKAEPTGYPNRGTEWLNSASLVARMNFGIALAGNHLAGVMVPAEQAAKGTVFGSPEFQRK